MAAAGARVAPAGGGRATAAVSLLLGGMAAAGAAVVGYRLVAATEVRALIADLRTPAGEDDATRAAASSVAAAGGPEGEWG